jgi:ribulose-5-phosphate 4-epimerase/fuculose-1-phosphate aldolase
MGNHGVMVVGESVADTFNRMYYFERAARTYIQSLWTGRELRILSDEIAEKTARETEAYGAQADRFLTDIKRLLDRNEPDYAD